MIFASDNGGYIGQYDKQTVTDNTPLRSGKGSLYEGGIRIPLIVSWPGVTPHGKVCGQPVVTTDMYYTLLTMAGLSVPDDPGAEGRDLTPQLKQPDAALARDALFFHYPHYYATTSPVSAVRAGDWKLLEYYEDQHVELYNLREDLSEQKNLAETMSDKAQTLRDRLHAWLQATDAQMPAKNTAAGK